MTEWQGSTPDGLVIRFDAPDPLDERAHGFGDAFMAARFIAPLLDWAGPAREQITFVVPPALLDIFTQSFPAAQFRTEASGPSTKALDRWGYGLWHVCEQRLRLDPPVPYLVASAPWSFDPAYLHVGLCLRGGNDDHKRWWDATRSIHDTQTVSPLFSVPDVVWHSLELRDAPPFQVVDHRAELRNWTDTANLIAGLDLVVAVDTAVAHLAGALGKPVWLMLRPPLPTGTRMTPELSRDATYGDQRWNPIAIRDGLIQPDTTRKPLYPTARLLYQPTPGAWPEVIHAVREELLCALPSLSYSRPSRDVVSS